MRQPEQPRGAFRRGAGLLLAALSLLAAGATAEAKAPRTARPFQSVRLAITIDDFPENGKLVAGWTRDSVVDAIVAALKKNRVRRVYGFALGSFASTHPEEQSVLERWLTAGNALGNHTYDHPHLNSVSADDYIAGIAHEDRLLATLDGGGQTQRQRRTFRYPYLDEGDTLAKRDAVRAFLFRNGYRVAEVTANYDDWDWTTAYARCATLNDGAAVAALKSRVIAAADARLMDSVRLSRRLFHRDAPQVLLMHLSPFTALTLDAVLSHWASEGVRFVSLDEALSDRVFAINPKLPDECAACVGDHGRPFFEQIAMSRGIDVRDYRNVEFSVAAIDRICAAPPGA
jgi:peptidoglycan/xylan/chitin deacetylase (PgdA/CDA1 family)